MQVARGQIYSLSQPGVCLSLSVLTLSGWRTLLWEKRPVVNSLCSSPSWDETVGARGSPSSRLCSGDWPGLGLLWTDCCVRAGPDWNPVALIVLCSSQWWFHIFTTQQQHQPIIWGLFNEKKVNINDEYSTTIHHTTHHQPSPPTTTHIISSSPKNIFHHYVRLKCDYSGW